MENKKDAYRTGIENMLNVEGIKVLANITVNKTLTDMEEVFETAEYKHVFRAVVDENKPFARKNREMYGNYKCHFTDHGLFEEYTIPEGLRILRELTTCSCLSDAPFNRVLSEDDNFIMVFEARLAKTMKNRRILAQSGVTVTDEF